MSCVFCQREVPTRGHHIVPRCKGGKTTVRACYTCENFIHKTWSHNELRDTFNTVESIAGDSRYQAFLGWLRKQPLTAAFRTVKNRQRSQRRYS